MSPEERQAWDITQFMKNPTVALGRCQELPIESRILLPQATGKKHTGVLAQDLETQIATVTKMITAITKMVGKSEEEINRQAAEQLWKRLQKTNEDAAENVPWAERFGLTLPTRPGPKRRARKPKADQ